MDLAQRNSAKVKSAQADVDKARAVVSESVDVYVPTVNGGAGLGQSYGYSTNPPTLFSITSQSLVYNSTQRDYIRSARFGLEAAVLSLQDARETVAQDTALAYAAVEHDQRRGAVLEQEVGFSERLQSIEEDRLSAGRDTQIDVTSAKLTAAQFRLSRLHAVDALDEDREHLGRLMGIAVAPLRVADDLPALPDALTAPLVLQVAGMTPGVSAAFSLAKAKQEQAFGDARFLYRPQIALFLQYNRYATFSDSFHQISTIYGKSVGPNEGAFGVQISVPVLDRYRKAKARESVADAAKAYHDAENAEFLSLDGRAKLGHSVAELKAKAEVAQLEQELAQQQLEAITVQLNTAASSGGAPLSPKDEQNGRIAEREKYLAYLDAKYQLEEAEINLLHETGQLTAWLAQTVIVGPKP